MHFVILSISVVSLLACSSIQPDADLEREGDLANATSAILATLNAETAAAFTRDYASWRSHWVHKPYVTKTYMRFSDTTLDETLGWAEVDRFVREYIESHPEPDPIPEPLKDAEVRLYGTGAHVSFEQLGPDGSRKREERLMELEEGAWKIAGMWTVVY